MSQIDSKILESWPALKDDLRDFLSDTDAWIISEIKEAHKAKDWDRVLNVNLKSVFNTVKSVARQMMKDKAGKIINISSVVGITGAVAQANYAAAKAGMIGLTKALAKELARKNICVNCIAPGYVKTRMTDALSEDIKEKILSAIPLGKYGETQDIANAVLF